MRQYDVPAVAENRLQHDRRHTAVDTLLDRVLQQLQAQRRVLLHVHPESGPVRVGVWHAREARLDRQERVVRMRPAGGHRCQRAAVVGVLQDDHIMTLRPVFEGELERHLDRQAAVQAIPYALQVPRRDLA